MPVASVRFTSEWIFHIKAPELHLSFTAVMLD